MPLRSARTLRSLMLAAVSLGAVGCGARVPSPETFSPPRPLSDVRPALVGASVESPLAVDVAVDVDAAGRPDLATLQLGGAGAALNRAIIADWLRGSVFEPGRHNGVPVRSSFRMTVESRVSVQPR